MICSNQQKRGWLSIVILVILSCPLFADGFHPSSEYNMGSRHATIEKRRSRGGPAKSTVTTLHAFPDVLSGVAFVAVGFAGWLYFDGADMRERNSMREEEEARVKAIQEERARLAYIEPKEYWTEAELAPYDGSRDEDGPILLAADGLVFNVYKGRNFYLPGCEYHIFAGRDATRLLARNKLEEETEEELKKPLSIADRAFLATWIYTFKGKYDIVGKLEGFDPTTTAM